MTADQKTEPRETLQIEADRQVCVARFHPGGRRCYGGGYDGVIRGWDLSGDSPQPLRKLQGHHGWVQCLDFASDELLISADSWGEVRATHLATGTSVDSPASNGAGETAWRNERAHEGWIRAMCVSEDGRLVATAGRDGRVRAWSSADGALKAELTARDADGDNADLYAVALHPDGHSLVAADLQGTLRRWQIESGELQAEARIESLHLYERIQDVAGVRTLRFHDGGRTLLVGGGQPQNTGTVQAVPVLCELAWPTLEVQRTVTLGEARDGFVFDLAWHPGGCWAVVCSGTPGQGKFLLLRPGEDAPLFASSRLSNCHSIDIDAAGRILVAATNKRSQGNGAVKDKDGNYLGNSSPLHIFEWA